MVDVDHGQAKSVLSQLVEISHCQRDWLWHALVSAMLDKSWSVDQTRTAVKRVKDAATPPEWADKEAIADAIVSGAAKPAWLKRPFHLAAR